MDLFSLKVDQCVFLSFQHDSVDDIRTNDYEDKGSTFALPTYVRTFAPCPKKWGLSGTSVVEWCRVSHRRHSSTNCVSLFVLVLLCPAEFLTGDLFRQLAAEIEPDELKIRSLGRQLLNFNATNDIFRSIDGDTGVAVIKILHRWKSANKTTDEGTMVCYTTQTHQCDQLKYLLKWQLL